MFQQEIQCWACGLGFLNIQLHLVQAHLGRPNNWKPKGPNNIHLFRKCYKKLHFVNYSKKIRAFNNYFGKNYYFRLSYNWQQKFQALKVNHVPAKQFNSLWHGIGD